MADLDDFIEIAADIAELFFDSRSEMRKKSKQPVENTVARPTANRHSQAEGSTSDIRFRGSLEPDKSTDNIQDQHSSEPQSPLTTANSTEAEYCETCIEEKDAPRPTVRLNSRNLREAFILSELISPPISRRGRRML